MSIPPYEARVIAGVLVGGTLDGELAVMSEPWRSLAAKLNEQPTDDRNACFHWAILLDPNRDALIKAVADQDLTGPPPDPEGNIPRRCATLADVRRLIADTAWPWPGWLAAGVLNALAADPGIGKTLLAMTLACTLWFKRPWPDGQENPFPKESKTLWIPGDRHYTQLLDLAAQYKLPDEALLLNASKDDPTGGLDLDDPAELAALKERIRTEDPKLAIVDTVGMTTARNLCRPEEARAYFGPLMEIAQETGVPFLLLTHLSRDAEALGRRIVGASRVVWKLTTPDPEEKPDSRRLSVDKSYAVKPKAMGMTIADTGCTFDDDPPIAPEPRRSGRPPAEREKARAFIKDELTKRNDQIGNELCARWEKDRGGNDKTFWRAVDDMRGEGDLTTDGGKGTGKQTLLHLNGQNPDP
jgi:hypothetical protein